jgi:hypothetical protein
MTQYLLAVHNDPDNPPYSSDEQMQQAFDQVSALNDELQAKGLWVFGGGLTEASSATVVRAHEGEVIMTDGPFVETKEQLGGFWVIEAPDLDAAIAWATKASVACMNPVEVRPFQDEPES